MTNKKNKPLNSDLRLLAIQKKRQEVSNLLHTHNPTEKTLEYLEKLDQCYDAELDHHLNEGSNPINCHNTSPNLSNLNTIEPSAPSTNNASASSILTTITPINEQPLSAYQLFNVTSKTINIIAKAVIGMVIGIVVGWLLGNVMGAAIGGVLGAIAGSKIDNTKEIASNIRKKITLTHNSLFSAKDKSNASQEIERLNNTI